jgi:hypothetical protein
LRDGITKCGYDTARFIEILTHGYGATVQTLSKYSGGIDIESVKPEEVDNLVAYTCAWIKLKLASGNGSRYYNPHWHLTNYLHAIECGERPRRVPLPDNLSDRQQIDFIKQYLKDDDQTLDVRQSLALAIEKGETLTLKVDAI